MRRLRNRKGTILVATYMVLCVIIIVASSFFSMVLTDNKSVTRDNDGARALSNAERGIAYAYYESYTLGWDWKTHEWNGGKNKLKKLPPPQEIKSRTDCVFDADGFYVHNSGDFMIKAYPDLTRDNDTVVISMGICGKERRVLMYYLTRRGIYDFFLYTPYNLDLYSAVGRHPQLNGGGIHSNGDIHIDTAMRLEDISELSAGESGKIYYEGRQYIPPYYADRLDGIMDGKSPITRLDKMGDVFRDDRNHDPGPFGYYNGRGQWCWDSGATYFVSTYRGMRNSFQSSEGHFAGSKLDVYNVAPGKKSIVKNDSGTTLNSQNCWIKPYVLDADGDQIDKTWVEIPAEMDTAWAWDKYGWRKYGTVAGEQPVSFYTYKDDGTSVDVANTYWEIDPLGDVEMLDPPVGGTPADWAAFNAAHPSAKQYWDMYATPEFWKSTYDGNSYYEYLADMVNPEVLDGTYGDERLSNDILMVNHTDSKKQPDDWKAFLAASGLDGIVRDGNTGGEYLEPPDFDQTYSRLAEKDGLYLDLDASFDGNYDDYDEWQDVLEKSIDNAVDYLNRRVPRRSRVAKKVKFINTFTGKWNVVLEIDFKNMQKASKYPKNGILYTKVPIRITNASELARAKPKYGFTVLGEENVYLKGDYNTDKWVTSAIVSKKRIFTLSDDFNDPQVPPALEHYPDYPYLYVKDDGTGKYVEVPKTTSGGEWVYSNYLDSDGAVDRIDYYPGINDVNEANLRAIISVKENDYRAVFNKDDSTGKAEDTWVWSGTGESYTSGMMPNKVSNDHTYNALMATNRWLDSYQSNKGDILENWDYYDGGQHKVKKRNLNGAFFVLENAAAGGFSAANNEFVDYRNESGLGYDQRGRSSGTGNNYWYSRGSFLRTYNAAESVAYDENFRTATRAPSDVFFGGAESLWAETTEDFFYKMRF